MRATIITVCLNSVEGIEDTIQSVLAQRKNAPIEYIVVDGGSIDGTLDVLNKYKDVIDVLICEQDEGIYDAMNKGIRAAHGDIIGFLNSGDRYCDNAIKEVARCFEKTEADVVYGAVIYTHEGEVVRVREPARDPSEMLLSMVACHQGIFTRADLQKKYEFDTSYCIAADRKMLFDLYIDGYRFARLNKRIAYYDNSGFSSSHPYELFVENHRITYLGLLHYPERYQGLVDEKSFCREVFLYEFRHDWSVMQDKKNGDIQDYFHSLIDVAKRIWIWGMGLYGEMAQQFFKDLGYHVYGFIDSFPVSEKKGNTEVYLPQRAPVKNDDMIVIATKNRNEEIQEQCASLDNLRDKQNFVFLSLLIEYEMSKKSMESILLVRNETIP